MTHGDALLFKVQNKAYQEGELLGSNHKMKNSQISN